MDVRTVVLVPLADAFMEVGVFVAILVAAFGWLRWRHGDRLIRTLEQHRAWAPALGALLGVSPGCAGAILVMPLYARGTVSFGGVVAALVATMGDSSWVIMAADPAMAAKIHALLFLTGLVTGYGVDALGIAPAVRREPRVEPHVPARVPTAPARGSNGSTVRTREAAARAATALPAGAGVALRAPALSAPALFWLLACAGFMLGAPVAFQAVDPLMLTTALGGVDPYLVLGVSGTAVAFVVFVSGRGRLADDSMETAQGTATGQPFTAVLRHGARETSFVVVWVATAYLAWALVHALTGFDGTQLPLYGVAGVAVGALVGLVPGCAVQIVFTGLYVSGALPLPTLLANAVSQDGDALLPLLALERRSALVATVVTTVPGLLVGSLALLMWH